jgi:predicted nucleic acid-binding protein
MTAPTGTALEPGCAASGSRSRSWPTWKSRQYSGGRSGPAHSTAAAQAWALDDLAALPAQRAPHRPLLARCWELRDNLTPYEAAYVALAEAMHAALLTGDRRLANATGPQCPIEVFRPTP